MSVNFFETNCKEPSRNKKQFGICDDQNGTKAYTDTSDDTKWIAKVTNDNEIDISFTAIDNCIIVYKAGTKEKESSCDGMLTFSESLYLVELKVQGKDWIPKAKRQLENTIKLITENHKLQILNSKKLMLAIGNTQILMYLKPLKRNLSLTKQGSDLTHKQKLKSNR